jgi:hypothetical protein
MDARLKGTSPAPARRYDGGCACGHVRYRMHAAPMFVHACHCTRCQRETGGPFAHHAMIEFTAFSVLQGEPEFVLVPTDTGNKHWVARCPVCFTAMWNEHGSRKAITRYVRVGTLDEPNRFPPLAHIYVRSMQSWLRLEDGAPQFAAGYDATTTWSQDSLARYEQAKSARAAGQTDGAPAHRKTAR